MNQNKSDQIYKTKNTWKINIHYISLNEKYLKCTASSALLCEWFKPMFKDELLNFCATRGTKQNLGIV